MMNSGITMVEVLISVVILTLISVPIIGMTLQGLNELEQADEYTKAVYYAHGEMEYLSALSYQQLIQSENINLKESDEFEIDLKMTPVKDEDSIIFIELTINWLTDTHNREYSISTYRTKRR